MPDGAQEAFVLLTSQFFRLIRSATGSKNLLRLRRFPCRTSRAASWSVSRETPLLMVSYTMITGKVLHTFEDHIINANVPPVPKLF